MVNGSGNCGLAPGSQGQSGEFAFQKCTWASTIVRLLAGCGRYRLSDEHVVEQRRDAFGVGGEGRAVLCRQPLQLRLIVGAGKLGRRVFREHLVRRTLGEGGGGSDSEHDRENKEAKYEFHETSKKCN